MASSLTWHLHLHGSVELRNPTGEVVKLPTRKTTGLLAMLVLARPSGLERERLARDLWPHADPISRNTNLRQCLARLREVLGADAIVSTREQCRLSESFAIECDCERCDGGDQAPFMADFNEPWVERIRSGEATSSESPLTQKLPINAFAELVRWCADTDPARAIDMMRDNLDLSVALRPKVLRTITDSMEGRLPQNSLASGWLHYWKAIQVLERHDLNAGLEMLRKVIGIGVEHADLRLQLESAFHLGIANICLGYVHRADRIVDSCSAMAERSGSPILRSRVDMLKGTILVHKGQTLEGVRYLEQAAKAAGLPIFDVALNQALRSLYNAISGDVEEAVTLLEWPNQVGQETQHFRLQLICSFAHGQIAFADNQPDRAQGFFQRLTQESTHIDCQHMVIYGQEALAVVAWKLKDKSEAVGHLKSSGKLRQTLKMGFTQWDRTRLKELPLTNAGACVP